MKQDEVIVALASGTSKSAISIVRLSGQNALDIAYRFLKPQATGGLKNQDSPLVPRQASLREIYDSKGRLLDKGIVIYFKAPHSFTGEDVVEIQSHGSPLLARDILESAIDFGARLALPGEFSKRALVNNKLGLLELEATLALINNTNTNLTPLIARNLTGEGARLLNSSRETILEVVAQIEVNIDYSEEALDEGILAGALGRLDSLQKSFSAILESSASYARLQGLKLSIIGRPNVGKSSLLNLLLLRDRAITSDLAGTTRDVVTENLEIKGNVVSISDTAGIRAGEDEIEKEGIKRSLEEARESQILICVFDLSSPMQSEDYEVLEFLNQDSIKQKSIIVALNKSDLARKNTHDFSGFKPCFVSSKDIKSREILIDRIHTHLSLDIESETLVLTNTRQTSLLQAALNCIKKAPKLLENGELELASFELMQALREIAEITKPCDIEEVLDSMFSQFCVGK